MGEGTEIAWTDHTFNPWWGCARVSPGCEHCYAETFSKRVGHGKRLPTIWGVHGERKFFGEKHWREPFKWNAQAAKDGVRRRVFCASMADVFEDRDELIDARRLLMNVIEGTPSLDWQLLTKRPENVLRLWRSAWGNDEWPANVWIGATVEDQKRADERIPELLKIPARVRFLSCEPLLQPVRIDDIWDGEAVLKPLVGLRWAAVPGKGMCLSPPSRGTSIDWVIVGGESGGGAREFRASWARAIVDVCKEARVPVFVKQFGAQAYDDITWRGSEPRYAFNDVKGGDWNEWPDEFRVRQFPVSTVGGTP